MSLILSGTDGISDVDGSASTPALRGTDANTGIFFPAADTIAFSEGGVESMRIDSSGRLLLGTTAVTTSSSQSGEIYSTGAVGFMMTNTTAANYPLSVKNEGTSGTRNLINFYEGAAGGTSRANISLDGSNNFAFASTNATTFSTASTERMRIDSSGNVGIACTPSAWGSTYKPIQFGLGGSIHGRTDTTAILLGQNTYRDSAGDYKYIATTAAGLYTLGTGIHSWFGAPSGTAGNTVTFTQVLAVSRSNSLALEGATSQAGTGITFPATQSASSDANTLDDYEEGTWTPSYGGGITAATYGTARAGTYIKIGRSVTIHFIVMTDSVTRGSGGVTITGLPFTPSSATGSEASLSISNATRFDSNPPLYARVALNATTIALYSSINATGAGTDPVEVAPTNLNTGSGNRNILVGTATYFTS